MVNKIVNYEKKPCDKSWFKNIVAVGGTTHPELKNGIRDGEADILDALEHVKNFNHIKLFSSKKNLTNRNVVKYVNKGCGFLVLMGHGNVVYWTTHDLGTTKDEILPRFTNIHMKYFLNCKKLPICIASGCRNSAFDTHIINLIKHKDLSYYWMDCARNCWMWAITKKATGGAIASIGTTALGYSKYETVTGGKADGWSYIIPQFFYEYKNSKTKILGEICQKVLIEYLKKFPIDWNKPSLIYDSDDPKPDVINARSVQQFILLGDPTLKIGGYKNI